MDEKLRIAGYCRISVDEELDKDNTSIENQKWEWGYFTTKRFVRHCGVQNLCLRPPAEVKFFPSL